MRKNRKMQTAIKAKRREFNKSEVLDRVNLKSSFAKCNNSAESRSNDRNLIASNSSNINK